jgi:hypothetical protein
VIPLFEVPGNNGAAEFRQSGPISVNAGVVLAVTTIFIVAVEAHSPAEGVNV